MFEKAADAALKKLNKNYIGMKVDVKLTYAMKGPSWIATAVATAVYLRTAAGGATYTTKSGDTLWDIAKNFYGSGTYWPVIADANIEGLKDRPDFILTGFPLKIPKIDVIAKICVPAQIEKSIKPIKNATKKARPVAFPTIEYDLDKSKTIKTFHRKPGATIVVKTTLKGTLKAQKPGVIPASFNLRNYETEIKAAGTPFESSIKLKGISVSEVEISSNVSGNVWKSSISMSKTGNIKLTIAPKPVSFKSKGIVFEGNVGLSMEMQILPDPPKAAPQPVPVYDQAWDWLKENGTTLAGGALIVGAGILIVATIGEDILTLGVGIADDPVSFAVAGAMFQGGMRMVR